MNTPDPRPDLERLARRRAGLKLGWYLHATVYVAVNLVLMALAFSTGRHWAFYPLLGWGLGLAIHGFVVWTGASGAGRSWEERKIRELMERG